MSKTNCASKKDIILRMGELFSGPGGLALGALKAKVQNGKGCYRIEHAWSNDFDEDSCKTYVRNILYSNDRSVICKDVRKINFTGMDPIDVFAYGFPCNDFSIVGEKKGINGEFGPLYTYGVHILNYFKPKIFIAENVGGITSVNEGKAFKKITHDLKEAGNGYNITAHLYKFEEYGVPQTRHRVIIVGFDKKLNLTFKVPKPITCNNAVTARQALGCPPIHPFAPNNELTKQSKGVIERLNHIKPGENAWTADLPARLKLNVKNTKLSHIYRRLHPDRPAYTITGSGGGGTHCYHWNEPRALTNRERARIQTFPDEFVFEGSKESVRRQIGMAVPPKMSETIFTAVLKTIAGVSYEYIAPNINGEMDLFEDL